MRPGDRGHSVGAAGACDHRAAWYCASASRGMTGHLGRFCRGGLKRDRGEIGIQKRDSFAPPQGCAGTAESRAGAQGTRGPDNPALERF
jgi:hypothetical protein